jgi:hypothetical protein
MHAERLNYNARKLTILVLSSVFSPHLVPNWSAHRNAFGDVYCNWMRISHREAFHVAHS